jgi:hypothetical protein
LCQRCGWLCGKVRFVAGESEANSHVKVRSIVRDIAK